MTLVYKEGNIFDTELPVIGHGVNLHGIMGSGFAVQIREMFPDIHDAYKIACESKWYKTGDVFIADAGNGLWIANIFSQDLPGANAKLEWIEEGVRNTVLRLKQTGHSGLALPHIGAGVGGLILNDVLHRLTLVSEEHPDFTIEVWKYVP